ncbi:MAG: HtaA domain-containing protein, partial [Corynebacterium sp.]|nr:HtaA domain-containing protein [Corynebacterium sp.]
MRKNINRKHTTRFLSIGLTLVLGFSGAVIPTHQAFAATTSVADTSNITPDHELSTRVVVDATDLVAEVQVPSKPTSAQDITTGAIDWGFRASWRNYTKDMELFYSDLTINDNGTYHLPVESGWYDAATNTTVLKLKGSLRWLGHHMGGDYLLDTLIENMTFVMSPDGAYIAGDYIGIAMDDMSGPRVRLSNIHIADADFSTASINQEFDSAGNATETTYTLNSMWGGRNMPIYTYPSRLDSLSVNYQGAGSIPQDKDETVVGDVPNFTKAEHVAVANGAQYYASKSGNGSILYGVKDNTVTAIDGSTMEVLGKATIPVPESSGTVSYQWGFYSEPSIDSSSQEDKFYAFAFGDSTQMYEVSFKTASKAFAKEEYDADEDDLLFGELEVSASQNPRLYWIDGTVYGFLFTNSAVYRFTDYGLEPSNALTVVSDGAPGAGSFAGFNNSNRIMVDPANPNSRYLITNTDTSSRGTGKLATIHLTSNRAARTNIATVNNYSAVDTKALPSYTHLLDLGNGSFFTYGSPGVYAFMTLNNGELHLDGEQERLVSWDLGGNYGAAASPDGKFIYLYNRHTYTIYVIDRESHKVLSTTSAPGAAGGSDVTGSLAELLADSEGNLYFATSTGLQKLKFDGIRAGFTENPTTQTLEYAPGANSATATFTVSTHGAESTDTITWQQRNSGALAWKDIEGATGPSLTLTVNADDASKDVRAVLHTSLGDIRSEVAQALQPDREVAPNLDDLLNPPSPEVPPVVDPASPGNDNSGHDNSG